MMAVHVDTDAQQPTIVFKMAINIINNYRGTGQYWSGIVLITDFANPCYRLITRRRLVPRRH